MIYTVAFFIALLFALLQTYLLKKLMLNVTAGEKRKSIRLFFAKFLLYGIAIALFVFRYMKYAMFCFCGFAAGMPLAAIVIFIYDSFIKKQ